MLTNLIRFTRLSVIWTGQCDPIAICDINTTAVLLDYIMNNLIEIICQVSRARLWLQFRGWPGEPVVPILIKSRNEIR